MPFVRIDLEQIVSFCTVGPRKASSMRIRTHIPDPDPMIGRTIHEFKLVAKLAEGGMGAVYLARHVLLPTHKVFKLLLPKYAASPALRQRFYREAEAASRLKHECILGIDNFGALEDGQLFITIPYLDGQPLDAYLRSHGGRLAPHRALHLILQLCDALDHAHSHGIIHRDLKPANVFLVPTNLNPCAVKLLDFGIAKIIGEQPEGFQTQGAMGTPSYMAVEQYEHADKATHLADIYSLAIMIWEMITGQLPWQHSEPAVLYHLQRTVIPECPPESEMPPKWIEILHAALSVHPDGRPQSARELAGALASDLPAVGLVPSGAEILGNLVPRFMKKASPADETVRNASNVDRIGPLLWSPGTAPEAPRRLPALDVASERADAPATVRTNAAAPDANTAEAEMLPATLSAAMLPTTLSAATGVATRGAERRYPLWKLALATIGTAAVAALATASIASNVSSDDAATPMPASASKSVPPPPRADEALTVEPQTPSATPHAPAQVGADRPIIAPRGPSPARVETPKVEAQAPRADPAPPITDASEVTSPRPSALPSVRPSPLAAPPPARRNSAKGSSAKPAESGSGARPSANIDPSDIW
jgi:serine/threonine protein kinase